LLREQVCEREIGHRRTRFRDLNVFTRNANLAPDVTQGYCAVAVDAGITAELVISPTSFP